MGNTNTTPSLYRRKFDEQGNYLPFSGYTIVANARHPLPTCLTDLVNTLSSSELKQYYSFLPTISYHVTINPLEGVQNHHLSLLKDEQRKLSEQDTSSICTADKLIRSKALLIEVKFNETQNENFTTKIQNIRSSQLQQANILHKYTLSWHLTLAYQYKPIENDEITLKLDKLISNLSQSSIFPFDIPLDHIRICHYDDMTRFTPI